MVIIVPIQYLFVLEAVIIGFLSVIFERSLGSSEDGARELLGRKQPLRGNPEEERTRLLARLHFKITRDRLSFGSVETVFMQKETLLKQPVYSQMTHN